MFGGETFIERLGDDGVRVLRAANPGWLDIVLDGDNETMVRGVAVFAGRRI
ncbi:MAG: hypothetical protein OXH09_23495 [Gammaproteobacteria bacterium]|nr:hypothetical protein [Gammaproteobacteria bacterium]